MDERLSRLKRSWRATGSLEALEAYVRALERAGRHPGLPEAEEPPTRQSRRHRRLEARIPLFMKQYGRKRPKGGGEPNDRKYDRRLERRIKMLDPRELDELMHG